MELDDMKLAWREMNTKLDALREENLGLRTDMQMDRVARSMWRTTVLVWFEAASNGLCLLLLAAFIARHDALRFTVAALILYPAVIANFASSVVQIVRLARLDYGGGVLAVQKSLESLYLLRLRTLRLELLFSLLLWVPLAIVLMRWMTGADLYAFGTAWLAANFALGVVAIPALWALARYLGPAFKRTAFGRVLLDDVAGHGLAEVRRRVAAIARFERE